MKKGLLLILLLKVFTSVALAISPNSKLPPIDDRFRVRVDFWKKVYTEINSNEGFIHDKEKIGVIYKKVDLKTKGYRKRYRNAKKVMRKMRKTFKSIIRKKLKNLSSQEKEIVAKGKFTTIKEVRVALRNLRIQYGLKDNYFIGLKRSHRFLDFIKKTFKKYGLPKELVYLPHVESSFNYQAYSKVGAAGIWQFMRSTGRMYKLKINYTVDERRDPIKSTIAAAKLLKYNYSKIKVWPLAITAYNHGLRSMQRALSSVGSSKMSDIIEKYDGRRFGFASKNFYATFIATVEISENPEVYFPEFKKPKPIEYITLKLPNQLTVRQILDTLRISKNLLKEYNPSIRSVAYRSPIPLPHNFSLNLPVASENEKKEYLAKLAQVETATRRLKTSFIHKVRRGDSLFYISKLYHVPIHDLIVFNQIANPTKIYPGMKLKIPGTKDVISIKKAPEVSTAQVPEKKREPKVKKTPWYKKLLGKEKPEPQPPETDSSREESIVTDTQFNLDKYNLGLKDIGNNYFNFYIETDETLGHYADWTLIRVSRIKKMNHLNSRSNIRLGQKLKLQLNPQQKKEFIAKRAEYHISIQEDFYENYKVTSTKNYKVRRGQNLSVILKRNQIPFWLFRQYQPKSFNILHDLRVGQILQLPEIEDL